MSYDTDSTRDGEWVEMPRSTASPLVLAAGIALLAMGIATSPAFLVAGAAVFVFGLVRWIGQLLPGGGHIHEPLADPARRPLPVSPAHGEVERLRATIPPFPASLELEIGVLEPQLVTRFASIPSADEARKFLARNAGRIHLFRQRIPLRNASMF